MITAAPEAVLTSPAASGAAACPERLYDCRCSGRTHFKQNGRHPAAIHSCGAPDCGALWVSPNHIIRLPGKARLRRRFDRADLRSAR